MESSVRLVAARKHLRLVSCTQPRSGPNATKNRRTELDYLPETVRAKPSELIWHDAASAAYGFPP